MLQLSFYQNAYNFSLYLFVFLWYITELLDLLTPLEKDDSMLEFQPIKCYCRPHIEPSQLICSSNQLTGFYIRETLAFNGINQSIVFLINFIMIAFKKSLLILSC